MKLVIGVAICIFIFFGIINIADWMIIGFAIPTRKRHYKKEYMIKNKNRMDFQKSSECSGFSFAYILRSVGREADGNDMYAQMPGKFKNGAVMPKNLKKLVQMYGFKVTYVKGSLESLKAELCEGNRVIVLIKTRADRAWLHYVPIVGYDEDNVFIAESLEYLVNCQETYYNRSLAHCEFLKLWDTRMPYMPLYKNTYLIIE